MNDSAEMMKAAQSVPELQYFVKRSALSKYELRDFNHVGHLKPVGEVWFMINHPSTRAMRALIASGRTVAHMTTLSQITVPAPVRAALESGIIKDIDSPEPVPPVRAVNDLFFVKDIDDKLPVPPVRAAVESGIIKDIDSPEPVPPVRAVNYDFSLQPGFKYTETVGNREERAKLPAHVCNECRGWYALIEKTHGEDMTSFCRHRALFAPTETPPDFWELSFVDERKAREAKGDGE